MPTLTYNDMTFAVESRGERWDITYTLPNGSTAKHTAWLPMKSSKSAKAQCRILTF